MPFRLHSPAMATQGTPARQTHSLSSEAATSKSTEVSDRAGVRMPGGTPPKQGAGTVHESNHPQIPESDRFRRGEHGDEFLEVDIQGDDEAWGLIDGLRGLGRANCANAAIVIHMVAEMMVGSAGWKEMLAWAMWAKETTP